MGLYAYFACIQQGPSKGFNPLVYRYCTRRRKAAAPFVVHWSARVVTAGTRTTIPDSMYGAAEAHADSYAQVHTPLSSPSTPAGNLGGAADYEPRPARRTVAVVAFGAAAALAYSAAPVGTAARLFTTTAAGFAARANPTSVPTNVAGPTYVLGVDSISANNEYERASGRKLADGTSVYKHLVEMHKQVSWDDSTIQHTCGPARV